MLRNTGNQRSSAGSTVGVPTTRRTTVTSPSHSASPTTESSAAAAEQARKRQVRKDDAIRKKLDQELGRKKPSTRAHGSTGPVQGTVGSLRPSQALTLLDTAMVVDAARIMAAKRADAVLVIDRGSTLVGIMTDKDLAFRVVAEGLDIHNTLVSQVMTRNPDCVTTETNATEALNKMVNGGFRHLPCLNADGDVVGLLDITKCLYEALEKVEKAHKSSKKLVDALEGMQSEWAQAANPDLQSYVDIMREKMLSPDLNSILDEQHGVAEIQTKTSVRDASKMMKQRHSTASLIMEDGRIAGIFTTKDIVVRVMAQNLEPDRTSVIRVMTPHPHTVKSSMTILDALKKMHENHYLHLPVVDDQGRMAGLVDVLQVSLAMLRQMNTMQGDGAQASEGPVWNKFWESSFNRDETGSEISASEMQYGTSMVGTSARMGSIVGSRTGENAPLTRPDDIGSEFVFKFKESTNGQVHRFASSTRSFQELYDKVVEKMGELEKGADVTLSYCDEENDQVLLLQDSDIADAVRMAFRNQWPLIRLSVMVSSRSGSSKDGGAPTGTEAEKPLETAPFRLDPIVLAGGLGVGLGVGLAVVFVLMKK
ncbi:hypothetical protein BG011_004810 [Mortierella polycephala]|uniref:CBS-domain-containing protein n=1 Tax=Mortierella polycephala TaxID=41804 RepID=A0A9P6PXC7_9FUNG|nr:hypothetical protein BG011_004810 [Mortierella polycephala]